MASRGRGRGRGDCRTYKFLGKCEQEECPYRHERVARNPVRECVRIPPGMTKGRVVGTKGCNLKELSSIAPCYIHVDEDLKKVTIITDSQEKLTLLTNKMKLILSQNVMFHISGPSWCYIHPLGVSSHGLYCFKPYKGRLPPSSHNDVVYELCRDLQQKKEVDSDCADSDIVTKLAQMSPSTPDDTSDGLRNTLQHVLHGAATGPEGTRKIQIHLNPRLNIKRALNDSLTYLCETRQQNNIATRLDARFGKVTWRRLTEYMYTRKHDIEKLAELLFSDDAKHRNIFTTDVMVDKAECVRPELARLSSSSLPLETFDVKVTSTGSGRSEEEGTRLDVRLQVKRKEDMVPDLSLLLVKKDEIRDVTFDIVNLHRQHDVRMDLRHYKCVTDGEIDHAVVREMISRITFPSRHIVRIQPKTSRWNVHLIRHKKKMTYILDENFAITIATVSEHSFDAEKDAAVTFDMRKEGHSEVELHNLSWECAFGRDARFSTSQALALHIERGSVDTKDFDTIPHPWKADSILRDFERFWDHMETLSEKLDGV